MLLLQEFDFEVKDRRGYENKVADNLSRLEGAQREHTEPEIDDAFPDEQVLAATLDLIPWFADFANFLVRDLIPEGLTYQSRNFFYMMLVSIFEMSHICIECVLITYQTLYSRS